MHGAYCCVCIQYLVKDYVPADVGGLELGACVVVGI